MVESSFDDGLFNLSKVLKGVGRKKSNFKIREMSIYDEKIDILRLSYFKDGIEIDKAKNRFIVNILLPTFMKEVSSFLQHSCCCHYITKYCGK